MATTLPLARHAFFHSTDLDETRSHVARVFCDHRLRLGPGERTIAARQHVAPLAGLTLSYLDYGGAVDIDPGPLGSFYLVQLPLAGRALTRCGREEIISTPALASVPHPDDPLAMRWAACTPHLIVRFEREALERRLRALAHGAVPVRPRFALGFDVSGAAGARWRAALELALAEVDAPERTACPSLAAAPLEDLLTTLFLYGVNGNHTGALHGSVPPATPRHVRHALDYIHDHATEPIGLAQIADAAGIGIRSLQIGFRRSIGDTPLGYLRQHRLELAHRSLHHGEGSVTDVAFRHGFTHLSRFAAAYRKRFGELPRETARCAATRHGPGWGPECPPGADAS